MGKNNMNTIFVLAVLFTALFAVSAFALPDNPPTCSLSSNTLDTETTAVLTVVSVDTLENAGVDTIRIYEGGSQISSKSCGLTATCVSTKTVVKTAAGDYSYYAICRDRSGQQTTSGTISVHFDGSNRPPVIDTYSPATPVTRDEDETINFRITAHDPDSDPMTYDWKVNGVAVAGATANNYNFQRDVTGTSQSYTVAAYVRDGRGGVDAQSWAVTINDAVPTVDARRDFGATECDTFRFSATVDSYDSIASYSWDFGDGTTGSGATVSHQFAENGTYVVRVTVTDSDGDTATDTVTVIVSDISPSVNAGADQTGTQGQLLNFSGTATMPCTADTIQNYTWNFGDGTTASGQTASHAYTEAGTYTVTFTVCDEDSCRSDTLIVTIEGSEPVADFYYEPADPIEGDTVNFYDNSTSYDPIVSWEWDLDGDGTIDSTEQNPDWSYLEEGDYTVCLTVTDDDGDEDTHCETIHIGNNPIDTDGVDLVLNTTSGIEPLDVEANCSATGGNLPYDFSIDFGDGTIVDASSATHTYVQNGTYNVTCIVTDADGDTASDSETVTVFDSVPTADFVWDPEFPEEAENVSFDGTVDAYDTPVTVEWDFGDGTTGSGEDVTHAFAVGGDYVVTMTVTDADGSVVVVTHTVHVSENPPEAEVYVDPLSGVEPLTVNVNCTAIGGDAPLDFEIDFGDGSAHFFGAEASHTYVQNGTYNLTCIVTDDDGDMSEDSETVDVFDTEPVIDFTYAPIDPVEGDTVDFDATISVYDVPYSISWDFGDGTSDTIEDPSHVYAAEGVYTVTLTVTDNDGSVVSVSHTVTVGPNAADVMLVANETSGYEPLTVEFGCAAIDGNAPFTYDIDFGDGTAHGTSATEVHTFVQNGTYVVNCTVTDADGDVSSDSVTVDVLDTVPDVDFTFSPVDPVEGDDVDFDGTITAYDTPVSWVWDFGDGTTSTADDPMHNYAAEGDYNVTLTATDADGSVVVAWHVVTVGNNEPFVNLLADPMSGDEGLNVSFNCTVTGGNAPLSFVMDYGDGSFGADQESSHVYTAPGSYVATCTVTDDDGDSDSDFVVINVANNAPVVNLTATPSTAPEGDDIDFDCNITGGDAPFTVLLDFGDGTTTTDTAATHSYALEGVYTASCTVVDDDGDIGFDDITVNITNNEPVVNLIVNATSGFEPMSVEYNCTVGAGNEPFTYLVDFGDGTTSTSATGTHDYPNPGTYPMVCTVTDVDGDWDDDTVGIHVLNNPPVVDLIAVPTAGLEGLDVVFTCNVTGGNAPIGVVLDFGDGTSTTSTTATHNYPLEGLFNATCTATDFDGDVGSDSELINISNNPPIVNLVANVTSGLEPLTVEFNCTVGGGNLPFVYSIDFGDGSGAVAASSAVHTYPVEGDFDATCTVTDVDGDFGSDIEHIEVLNNPPVVDLIAVPTAGLEGIDVVFTCNVTGGNIPFAYVLDFGDGSSTTSSGATHNYPLEGVYNASCTVVDADGDLGMDDELINISNNPPVVNLIVNVSSGFEPLSVAYNCTVGGGNEPFAYVVDFGDGSGASSSPTGTHDYPIPGVYSMTCTVTDVDGDWDDDVAGIHVIDNPPVVDLIASPTVGPEGIDVSFNCSVTGGNAPIGIVLDFGDGTSTTSSIATHNYPLEGLYNATCTATDADGDVGSDSELINISNNAPVVNLIVNTTSGFEPLSVAYNCTVGAGNIPFAYIIDFGDGSATSSSETGTHVYSVPGTYSMSCTVIDVDGDSDDDAETITVLDNAPVVDLIAVPTAGLEGINVSFNCSVVGGNAPIGLVLDFGDGTSTTSATATHNYPLEGVFNATCTATDADGDVGSDSQLINISNNAPVVNLVTNVTDGTEPLSVFLNCTLVGGGNPPYAYMIDFGDGSVPVFTQTATHTYLYNSTYDASCTITDTDGDVSVPDFVTIEVYDSEPDANFTYSPSSPIEGDMISFTDLSTAYDGIVSWSWDLGDGNTSVLMNPTHTYDVDGVYIVTLTVTDGDGSATSHVEAITVGNNAPVVTVTAVPDSGVEPWGVTVTCSATGGNAPLTYLVQYGDGSSTSALVSAHTYVQNGSYPVVCQVTDIDGDVGLGVDSVTVNDTVPTADFTFAPASPRAGDTVNFTDLSTAYDGIASWAWDFENDGVVDSALQNSSHVFASPGLYVVNLSVTDSDGSAAWTIRTVAVNVSLPAPIIFNVQAVGITNVSANITWQTDQSADSEVEYSIIMGPPTVVSDASLVTARNLMLSGLAPDTTYYYTVTSCNAFSVCSSAGVYNFTTLSTSVPDLTAPGNVSGLGESGVGSDWIQWSWTNPSDADFDHVEIWVNGSFVANTSGTSYNVTGLSPSTDYVVEIITVDTSGNRNTPGMTDSATTTAGADLTAPGPVTGLGETAVGADWINWAWTNPSDIDFNHVELWLNGTNVANTSGVSYNATGLAANTTYQLTVITVDNVGNRNTPGVSDLATTGAAAPVDTVPVVTASATPASGSVPLMVQLNATVVDGNAPLSYAWDFDSDGIVDSTLQNPIAIYNLPGVYTAVVNVTDADGDWDTDSVTVTSAGVVHDIAVNSVNYTKEGRTVYLYDAIQFNASVSNQGSVDETFNLQLEIDGLTVANQIITLGAGASTAASFNWSSALPEGFRTVVVRAVPVVGETDLGDNSFTKTVRVWSVNDILSTSTRYIVYWAGSAYVPVGNAYVHETFYDLRVELTSPTAVIGAPAVRSITLLPSETQILVWSVAAIPGDVLTAVEGNNEVTFSATV